MLTLKRLTNTHTTLIAFLLAGCCSGCWGTSEEKSIESLLVGVWLFDRTSTADYRGRTGNSTLEWIQLPYYSDGAGNFKRARIEVEFASDRTVTVATVFPAKRSELGKWNWTVKEKRGEVTALELISRQGSKTVLMEIAFIDENHLVTSLPELPDVYLGADSVFVRLPNVER